MGQIVEISATLKLQIPRMLEQHRLIVTALNDSELKQLYTRAGQLGLDVLCEVHDEKELARALNCGCQ